jgi:tetratricopeptide (TPR) repeat protein
MMMESKEHRVALPAIVNSPHQQFPQTSGRPLIVQDILTPQDRPVRLPLPLWAAARLNEFGLLRQQSPYDKPETCGAIVDCFNEAALIEVYYGRLDMAATLCHAAMRWVAGLVDATGSAFCYRFAFQPYVNLGRLDRIEKRWQESLDKFQVVEEAVKGRPVRFGPIAVDRTSLESIAAKFPDPAVLRNIFILDTLKTLLKATWYDKLLRFFPSWIDDPMKNDFICEAFLVALGCMQKPTQALELNDKFLRDNPKSGNRLVYLYRRIEILLAMNDLDGAIRLARKLAAVFTEYEGTLSHNKLIVLAKICEVMISLELSEAASLLQSGLNAASKLGDVFLQREFLQMLAKAVSASDVQEKVHRSLHELSATGLYGAARKTGDVGAEGIQVLSDQLLTFAGHV